MTKQLPEMCLFRKLPISVLISFLLILSSCIYFSEREKNDVTGKKISNFDKQTNETKIFESKGFGISYHEYYKILEVKNPWQKSKGISYDYLLLNRGNSKPNIECNEVINIPVERIVCLSTTHIGYLEKLNELDVVVGISGSGLVYNSILQEKISNKDLVDVGYDSGINYELIVSLKPDVVFAYSVQGAELTYLNKLRELGIPVVIVGEYLETNPLARAEWIKFFASFFNKEARASEVFEKISLEYRKLKRMADTISNRPKIISGLPWKGSWYVPQGLSYQAILFEDAGADYIWSEIEGRESSIIDIEKVVREGSRADFWINPGQAQNLKEILDMDERLGDFSSIKLKNVYNSVSRVSNKGGMDYWESGPANPDRILKDLIYILHPELLPEYNLFYYRVLE